MKLEGCLSTGIVAVTVVAHYPAVLHPAVDEEHALLQNDLSKLSLCMSLVSVLKEEYII